MSDETREPTPEERDRATAEAEKFRAEARKAEAEAAEAEHKAAVARLSFEREQEKRQREKHADAYNDHTYRFLEAVSEQSVIKCINQLDAWHRESPDCSMTIVFDSPGGSVIPGFHLFDHILTLREKHEIDTITRGYAASMGGILLQAGRRRIMGANATLMLHEVSFGASGKIGDVEDSVEFAKLLWNRALDIFAERCAEAAADTATKRLSRRTLDNRSRRKNWWIPANQALAFGLVDEVA
jgi:ATP-dependent protease ClpP protease subunit